MTIKRSEIWAAIEPLVLKVVQKYRASEFPVFSAANVYSVSWTGATTNPAIGNGTLTGRYQLFGKMVHLNIYMVAGSTTTFGSGNWSFSLPFTAASNNVIYLGNAQLRDSGVANYPRMVQVVGGASVLNNFLQLDNNNNVNAINSSSPWSWGSGDSIAIDVWYERE